MLVLGLLLWSIVHFSPGLAANLKKDLVSRFGENPYKGAFALLMVVSLYLMFGGSPLTQ